MPIETNQLREFGSFRLDTARKVLWHDGTPVNLPLKEVELLCVLTDNRGEVVTKDEILDKVWADSFVEESNLSRHIYMLRKTFRDFGEDGELIQTVPRRGYRFAGDVRQIDDANGDLVIERRAVTRTLIEEVQDENGLSTNDRPSIKAKKSFLLRPALLVPLAVAAVLVGGLAIWRSQRPSPARISPAAVTSIAVLPLKTFAGTNEHEELRMRITDALITRLGASDQIAVRPTTAVLRFAAPETDAIDAGRKLGVDSVLDGRVQVESERVRVTLQMISVADGQQIWSEQFDGNQDQILNLQDVISAKIVKTLGGPAGDPIQLASRPTENVEAYEVYLKGRYYWSKRSGDGFLKAIAYFEQAVALDPRFAEAYAGLADTQYLLFDYNFDVTPAIVARARENLYRALELKPDLTDALTTLGTIQMNYDWDWTSAGNSLKHAAAAAPNSPIARARYGSFLLRMGRFDEARAEFERVIELDPLSVVGTTNLGTVFFCKREFAAAEAQFRKTFEIDDNFGTAHWMLARSLWLEGRKQESVAEMVRGLDLGGASELARKIEAEAKRAAPEEAIRLLLYEWRDNPRGTNPHNLAYLSIYVNDRPKALDWLEASFAEHHPWTVWIVSAPEFQQLRDEPRFQELLRKMNLR